MSPFNESASEVRLSVGAEDPTTQIFVIDGRFNLVSQGLGRLEEDLTPGLYKVKFKAGSVVKEVDAILEPGSETVYVPAPEMDFSTSAPLVRTRTTQRVHEEQAYRLSQSAHETLGQGSQLFVFARDLEKDNPILPAWGLTLHSLSGELLADFSELGERDTGQRWAGCTLALDPGSYRLRVQTEVSEPFEQIVVACPDWQTQVFLLPRPYGARSDELPQDESKLQVVRCADLINASILMARTYDGFIPDRQDMRWTEVARLGLADGRAVVSGRDLRDLLGGKWQNPMLGIFSGHILRLAEEPNLDLLDTVVENLRGLVGDHPDVEALSLWLDDLDGELRADGPTYERPPMLRNSWRIVVESSVVHPDIVPANSLSAQISDRTWGEGAWLVWRAPSDAPGARLSEPADPASLQAALPQIEGMLVGAGAPGELSKQGKLNGLEDGLLQYIAARSAARGRAWAESLVETSLSDGALVQALGVPSTAVRQATGGLIKKLELEV